MQRHTFTIDAAASEKTGRQVGEQIAFSDGLPTGDDGLAFYISQLANLESRIYEAKYTAINFEDLVPVNTDVPEWADNWDYISYDAVTLGKFIGSSADDLPNVALAANKSSVPIRYAGNMYDYSLDELRKSQQLRIPLDTTKASVARRGSLEHSQRVAYFGDADLGMTGLFNNANLALDNSVVDWYDNATTGLDICGDMNGLLEEVWINSSNVHMPNILVLDSARWAFISRTPMSATFPEKTILRYFRENNIYTETTGRELMVVPRLQLKAAELAANGVSNGGKDRMMAYEMTAENLGMVNPIPWRSLAPQFHNLTVKIPCEYKISGTEFRYPFSGAYRDHL